MEIIEKENELVSGGNTRVVGKYESLNELKSYLNNLSKELEEEINNKKTSYDNKRIDYLRKPLKSELINLVFMKDYNYFLENDVNKHIHFHNKIPKINSNKDYDSLFKIVKDDLNEYLKKDIQKKFSYLNKKIKEKYGLEIDENNLYYSLDMKNNKVSNNSYNQVNEEFHERWGLPIKIKNSYNIDEFYLLDEGFKVIHDNGKSYLLKDYSNRCLEDLIENGTDMKKDICKLTSKYTTPL